VNRDELFSEQYKKHLATELRTAFGYEGCPIVLVPKARPKTIEPVRKFKPARQKQTGKAGRIDAHRKAQHERYSRTRGKKSRGKLVHRGE
jgi:hypothetical protein